MENKLAMILLIGLSLCLLTHAFAETIILKSGQKIEAKIIEKTDEYIKIDFYGAPVTYSIHEIESIGVDADWYVNNDFAFKIRKLSGWEFKEDINIEEGIPMLSLGFTKPTQDRVFKNTLIINISKPLRLNNPIKKGDWFIAYADSAIDSATKNFEKISFDKETASINNVIVRKATFEWIDREQNNERFITTLMFFEPVEINSENINAFLFFKCKLTDYPSLSSDIETSLMSIGIGEKSGRL